MTERTKILIVEDAPSSAAEMQSVFIPMGFACITAPDGEQALAAAMVEDPDVILVNMAMSGQDGLETVRRLRNDAGTRYTPLIAITATEDALAHANAVEAGADDFLSQPVDKELLGARVRSLLRLNRYRRHLESQHDSLDDLVAHRTAELQSALDSIKRVSLEVILRLARASEYKDSDTGMHIERMSRFAAAIARQMRLSSEEVENLLYAAPMHDIGKIGIPDNILLKPDRLTNEEWETMKQHTVIGACILEGSEAPLVDLGRIIALTHHERWDGTGYPMGLAGEDIPLAGRITSVSDVFDALSSRRPYKDPISIDDTLQMVRSGRGTQFDPAVVDALCSIQGEIEEIRRRYRGI